jgi:predicted nuclease of predicted toxin-antitoxin system
VRFLVDNQLPPTLVDYLRERGHEAAHVVELGLDASADAHLWNIAARDTWIIITKDEDLSQMVLFRPEKVQVLWVRLGNCRKQVLMAAFERSWADVTERLSRGDRLVELY